MVILKIVGINDIMLKITLTEIIEIIKQIIISLIIINISHIIIKILIMLIYDQTKGIIIILTIFLSITVLLIFIIETIMEQGMIIFQINIRNIVVDIIIIINTTNIITITKL